MPTQAPQTKASRPRPVVPNGWPIQQIEQTTLTHGSSRSSSSGRTRRGCGGTRTKNTEDHPHQNRSWRGSPREGSRAGRPRSENFLRPEKSKRDSAGSARARVSLDRTRAPHRLATRRHETRQQRASQPYEVSARRRAAIGRDRPTAERPPDATGVRCRSESRRRRIGSRRPVGAGNPAVRAAVSWAFVQPSWRSRSASVNSGRGLRFGANAIRARVEACGLGVEAHRAMGNRPGRTEPSSSATRAELTRRPRWSRFHPRAHRCPGLKSSS